MKTVCIVQARIGSTRLPGKVLLPLNGHTVIGEVLNRCLKIPGVDEVICALPETNGDDSFFLSLTANDYCKIVFGSEHDVLGRYFEAATDARAGIVMRITGDCPLICPELCGAVLSKLKTTKADYASNVWPRTFPKGMDCEAFTMDVLKKAYRESTEREHVTTWMLNADIKRVNVENPWKLDGRLTLDTADDYAVICAAFGHKPYECLRAA